jgi:hypothetical protein
MVATLDDTKRMMIGERLADLKAVQNLIIANDQKLLAACHDADIRDRLQNMLQDDQKNLGIIETVIVQYGIPSEPSAATKTFTQQSEQTMAGDEFTFYQKLLHHELMKHGQTMNGIMIHKAAQVVGADIEVAITPLNTVNFESRAHQEQLKGMLEQVGVREMTGQEAKQGLWARVQDATAALSGYCWEHTYPKLRQGGYEYPDVDSAGSQQDKYHFHRNWSHKRPSKAARVFWTALQRPFDPCTS